MKQTLARAAVAVQNSRGRSKPSRPSHEVLGAPAIATIAVAGFQHETNTFAPVKATFEDFEQADAWPGLLRGKQVVSATRGMNLPVSGFAKIAEGLGHRLVPLLWCAAPPSAAVEERAYERIAAELLDRLARVKKLDAIYLDLHGAMVTEHLQDGEGELLHRVRDTVGESVPVVASLDFHANVTPAMVDLSDALAVYRTYPHLDMADTGGRAAALLNHLLSGRILHSAYRRLPYLIPLTWQCTLTEPMSALMHVVRSRTGGVARSVEFVPGFPLADVHDCGPSVLAYADDAAAAETAADELRTLIQSREDAFRERLYTPDEAIAIAADTDPAAGPVVFADTQDNPGAGGHADTVGIIRALIEQGVADAVVAVLNDPEVAAMAHQAGVGARIDAALGAKSGFPGETPLRAEFRVEALGDGRFRGTGPFYAGCEMQLGPMALLGIDGVRIIVSSRKQQAADQAEFRHLGIEPAEHRILVLKSSVHFRADFEPIAARVLLVESPGPNLADPAKLPFRRLRAGVRLRPMGPAFTPPSPPGPS
jgi:microcystin degradation protein MlrC